MAWFDDINIDELSDAPDSVKKILTDAAAQGKTDKAKLDSLETTVNELKTKMSTPSTNPNNPPADPIRDAQLMALESTSQTILLKLSMEYKDWKIFVDEINQKLAMSPINLRADEKYVRNIYNLVRGEHLDEIQEHNRKREGKYFSEVPSGGNPPVEQKKTGVDALSQAELDWCTKNRIKPEIYAKSKEYHQPVLATN